MRSEDLVLYHEISPIGVIRTDSSAADGFKRNDEGNLIIEIYNKQQKAWSAVTAGMLRKVMEKGYHIGLSPDGSPPRRNRDGTVTLDPLPPILETATATG